MYGISLYFGKIRKLNDNGNLVEHRRNNIPIGNDKKGDGSNNREGMTIVNGALTFHCDGSDLVGKNKNIYTSIQNS